MTITDWPDAWLFGVFAVLLTLTAATFWLGRRTVRRRPARDKTRERTDWGDLLAAAIATAVAAEGMWETFEALDVPIWLRAVTFAFIEINVIQCARRARRTMQQKLAEIAEGKTWEKASSGIDGIAMWVLTCISAGLSVAHELTVADPNLAVVLVRLVAPLVAAWGWERHMALERHSRGLGKGINWSWTLERVAVKAGLAEASARTTEQVDARRRITRLAQAVKALAVLEDSDAKPRRLLRAQRRVDQAMQDANEYAGLARDPELQRELVAEIGSLLNAAGLSRLNVQAWWGAMVEPVREEAPGPVEGSSLEVDRTEEDRTSDRLVRRLQLRRAAEQAMRDAVRGVEGEAVRGRTAEPGTGVAAARTEARPAPRTDEPPSTGEAEGTIIPLPVEVPYGQASEPLPHVSGGRTREPEHGAEQPRAEVGPRTVKARTVAAEKPRTGRAGGVRMDVREPRTYWVDVLAEEIRVAGAAGRTWKPDYQALTARTGYGRSWCEKTVHAARVAADASVGRTGIDGA